MPKRLQIGKASLIVRQLHLAGVVDIDDHELWRSFMSYLSNRDR